jgi:hypothetical protein
VTTPNLTPDELEQGAAAMLAHRAGKPVQFQVRDDGLLWMDYNDEMHVEFDFSRFIYRIKPEPPKPVTRPWTMADVPPVCWIRWKTRTEASLVCFIDHLSLSTIHPTGGVVRIPWDNLAQGAEWSRNLEYWGPCTIEVTP